MESSQFFPGCTEHRAAKQALGRKRAAECIGDGVKRSEGRPCFVGDGYDRIPPIGDELGLEGLQALKIVKTTPVGAKPS